MTQERQDEQHPLDEVLGDIHAIPPRKPRCAMPPTDPMTPQRLTRLISLCRYALLMDNNTSPSVSIDRQLLTDIVEHADQLERNGEWQPISTAPKGVWTRLVTDPEYIQPPKILLWIGEWVVGYWDWYYAEGGRGCTDGMAWVGPEGVPLDREPTAWQPLPKPPEAK